MSDILFFEDFPVERSFEFGRAIISAAQIRAYGKAFDARAQHGGPGALRSGTTLTASPWQLCAILMRLNYDGWMFQTAARGAPGVDEVRWLRPVHSGDVVTGRATIINARISQSKPHLGLIQYHYEVLGEDRKPVLSQTNYVMVARRHPGVEPAQRAQRSSILPNDRANQPPAQRIDLGSIDFTAESILAFARVYDPQPFHVDESAARNGPFGALAASGWHTAASWMGAYVKTCQCENAALPRLERFLSLKNLRWLQPVYAGDRITFDFMPIEVGRSEIGETIVTSRNSGINQNALKVFEFTATTTVTDRQ